MLVKRQAERDPKQTSRARAKVTRYVSLEACALPPRSNANGNATQTWCGDMVDVHTANRR